MAKGIPIRLVQENGNLIELDATSMVLSTTRKVGGSALPWQKDWYGLEHKQGNDKHPRCNHRRP
jgi:hypothetical protein